MTAEFSFTCATCGERHVGIPDLAFDAPYYYEQLPPGERESRARMNSEACIIDGRDRFIRGVIEIPILGRDQHFRYGVWVSLSERSFERYTEMFESPDPQQPEPFFGWLSNRFPGYPDTLNLKTHVFLRPYPTRPWIELHEADHPLVVEATHGITESRVMAILEANAHPS
jgi:hypothetical protein